MNNINKTQMILEANLKPTEAIKWLKKEFAKGADAEDAFGFLFKMSDAVVNPIIAAIEKEVKKTKDKNFTALLKLLKEN